MTRKKAAQSRTAKTVDRGRDLRARPGALEAEDEYVSVVRDLATGQAFWEPGWLREASPQARESAVQVQSLVRQIAHLHDHLDDAVADCRRAGLSWDRIGWAMDLTGEAVRRRFSDE